MHEQFSRTAMLIGEEALEKLFASRVAVFGIGGVGSYVAEALARAGVGVLDIVDNDVVSLSNVNRQLIATHSAVGRYKVDVAAERIKDINPACVVNAHRTFFLPGAESEFDFPAFDYVADAVDTVAAKLALVGAANSAGVPIISCMGAGNKLDPSAFRAADIYETSVCPLAKVMRAECRKRGIKKLKVVYSTEPPIKPAFSAGDPGRRAVPGSAPFVPGAAGLVMAGEIIRDIISK